MPDENSIFVLTLTPKGVSLHKLMQENLAPSPTEDATFEKGSAADVAMQLPANLQEALRYDEFDDRLTTHRHQEFLARRYMVVDDTEHHPSDELDTSPQKRQKYLRRYLRELDRVLCDLLQDRKVTLRLAGDPDICALYGSITAYPRVEMPPLEMPPLEMPPLEIPPQSPQN